MRAHPDERGQKLSKQDFRVEQRVSVVLFVSERVKEVRMKPLRIGERERASIDYPER